MLVVGSTYPKILHSPLFIFPKYTSHNNIKEVGISKVEMSLVDFANIHRMGKILSVCINNFLNK